MATAPKTGREQAIEQALITVRTADAAYMRDEWRWLREQVYTLDEASQEVREWPANLEYLEQLTRAVPGRPRVGLPKSRRMMASWWAAAHSVYLARYHPGHAIFWISETERKSAYVLDQRCSFIEDNLADPLLRRPYKAQHGGKDGLVNKIVYEGTGSYIWALPEGSDVLRAFTSSLIVLDECEFQSQAHRTLTAALPMVEKGCALWLISSSAGPGGILAEVCASIGFDRWTGGGFRVLEAPGGWCIVPIHYSMDPAKGLAWAVQQRASYIRDPERRGSDWARENEIDFTSISGAQVAANYSTGSNAAVGLHYMPELPLRLACDFNVDPMAWVVCQYRPPVLYVLDEIFLSPGSVDDACDEFIDLYDGHEGELWVYGDPSGHSRSQQDGRSHYHFIRTVMQSRSFSRVRIKVPRAHYPVKDSTLALNAMLRTRDGESRLVVDAGQCPELIKDLTQVVWADNGRDIRKVTDTNDPYFKRTHLLEALRNLVAREWPVSRQLREDQQRDSTAPKRARQQQSTRRFQYGRVAGDAS